MSWTAPRTWVTGEIVTASLLNTHLRDNLLASAVAQMTTAGDLAYASGANAVSRLAIGSAGSVLTVNGGGTAPQWSAAGVTVTSKSNYTTGSQNIGATTVLANVTNMVFAVAANEVWAFTFSVNYTADTTGDAKFAITTPAAATLDWLARRFDGGATWTDTDVNASGTSADYRGTGAAAIAIISGFVANGANAGNIQLQGAQQSGGGSSFTINADSYFIAWQLA